MWEINLNGSWMLKEEPLAVGMDNYGKVTGSDKGWIEAEVPGDVHLDLKKAGKIQEPLEGLTSFDCKWIENRSWWYQKTFVTEADWLQADAVELELNGLDAMADIFINGNHLGRHPSAFRPFIYDIKEFLYDPGEENTIIVRATSGLEHFSEGDISAVAPYVSLDEKKGRGDKRRVFVRKPQYVYGWDWSPRLATCGITGEARIRILNKAVIRDVYARIIDLADERAEVEVEVNLESLDWTGTQEGSIQIQITDQSGKMVQEAAKEVFLHSGFNYIKFKLQIDDPQLWWPHGLGEQYLYQVKVTAAVAGEEIAYPVFAFGIRTVTLDQQKINNEERLFAFIINGKRVYCRGANWLMPDSIYARTSVEKYKKLVAEAKEANFNMFRVNGVGIYERDCFYDYCDQAGILVWQDFTFSCGAYPDQEQWFIDEVKKEIDFQTTRLRNHPCLSLWCGSNENTWGLKVWWQQQTTGGARIYNKVIPEILENKTPDIPYLNGSPYGGEDPNCAEIGDRHHWHDCMMNADMEKRITPEQYDKADPKFISEFGYIGPCCLESIEQYLGDNSFNRDGEVWQHHTNAFEKDTVVAGINKHYLDSDKMTDEDYLLYGGLCQGLMLSYALDSFRRQQNCSGALFWMYNDCWGEIGWTIIDYYLNRKIAYHFVRRANAPVRLIMREAKGTMIVTLANDTGEELNDLLEFGYMAYDGSEQVLQQQKIAVNGGQRKPVVKFDRNEYDLSEGCLMARLADNCEVDVAIVNDDNYRDLNMVDPELQINNFKKMDNDIFNFTIKANKYAHAVHFGLSTAYHLSDEYFDLLPGSTKKITVYGEGLQENMLKPRSVIP